MTPLKTPVDIVNMIGSQPLESKQQFAAKAVKLCMQVNGARMLDEVMITITKAADNMPPKLQNEFTNLAVEIQVMKETYLSKIDKMI